MGKTESKRTKRKQRDYGIGFKLAEVSQAEKGGDDIKASAIVIWDPGQKQGIGSGNKAW